MAGDPSATGQRSFEVTFNNQSTTPFAGVSVTDPTPGAIDTVYIGAYPVQLTLRDGDGYSGLMNQPFSIGISKIGQFFMLQGTSSQVTAELNALVLTPLDYTAFLSTSPITVAFNVQSSTGSSSETYSVKIEDAKIVPSSQRIVDISEPNQAVGLRPFDIVDNHHAAGTDFVFSPGNGIDVIHGFKFGGADHDTLRVPSADFANLAAVLANTGDVNGSAFITAPRTGDAIRLAGVSKAELKAHPKDIVFYG